MSEYIAALTSNKVASPEFAQQALQDLKIVDVDSDLGLIAEQLQCEICKKVRGHGIISFSMGVPSQKYMDYVLGVSNKIDMPPTHVPILESCIDCFSSLSTALVCAVTSKSITSGFVCLFLFLNTCVILTNRNAKVKVDRQNRLEGAGHLTLLLDHEDTV